MSEAPGYGNSPPATAHAAAAAIATSNPMAACNKAEMSPLGSAEFGGSTGPFQGGLVPPNISIGRFLQKRDDFLTTSRFCGFPRVRHI